MWLLLAQVAPTNTSWADVIGPYGALVLALGAIAYLVKQLAEERKARNEMAERLVDQAEKVIPVLEANTRALDDCSRHLDRLDRR